jgi:hypothetical protein
MMGGRATTSTVNFAAVDVTGELTVGCRRTGGRCRAVQTEGLSALRAAGILASSTAGLLPRFGIEPVPGSVGGELMSGACVLLVRWAGWRVVGERDRPTRTTALRAWIAIGDVWPRSHAWCVVRGVSWWRLTARSRRDAVGLVDVDRSDRAECGQPLLDVAARLVVRMSRLAGDLPSRAAGVLTRLRVMLSPDGDDRGRACSRRCRREEPTGSAEGCRPRGEDPHGLVTAASSC